MKKVFALITTMVVLFTLTGTTGNPAVARADGFTPVNEVFRVRKGHTRQIVTELGGSNLKWSSENKAVASVNAKGEVCGIMPGKTNITVSSERGTLTYKIKVTKQVVAIDAGHQGRGNSNLEPIGPGASERKPKVSSGTQGVATGIAEYELNLAVAKKLEKALKKEGYRVIMIRRTNDVDISNSERAKVANKARADVFIRIHANSSTDSSINGVLTISPTASNPYCASIYKDSSLLSKCVVDEVSNATGARNTGVWQTDSMSGINWCKVPVTILEMGYMSNPTEDRNMAKNSYRNKIVKGTVKGINKYLGNK